MWFVSLEAPLGTGIAWTTQVLFLAVRWISGLWKILFQVLGFTLQCLLTPWCLNCYTRRLYLFTVFIIPNLHVIRTRYNSAEFIHRRLKNKMSCQMLRDYLVVVWEQFLLLLHWKWKCLWKRLNIQLQQGTSKSLQILGLFSYSCRTTHMIRSLPCFWMGLLTHL